VICSGPSKRSSLSLPSDWSGPIFIPKSSDQKTHDILRLPTYRSRQ
jgi:hypothetical protein